MLKFIAKFCVLVLTASLSAPPVFECLQITGVNGIVLSQGDLAIPTLAATSLSRAEVLREAARSKRDERRSVTSHAILPARHLHLLASVPGDIGIDAAVAASRVAFPPFLVRAPPVLS